MAKAAIGRNNELGKGNDLIWKIPADLAFFKEHTINKKIIMGKNTLDSLPQLLPKSDPCYVPPYIDMLCRTKPVGAKKPAKPQKEGM